MTNQKSSDENLSAFLDGEAGSNKIDCSTETAKTASRYSQIGAALRNESLAIDASSTHQAVSQRLNDEPTVLAPRRWHERPVLRFVSGTAIAATVAMMAILVAPQISQFDQPSSNVPQYAFAPPIAAPDGLEVVSQGRVQHGSSFDLSKVGKWETLESLKTKKYKNCVVKKVLACDSAQQ
jgi:negative regulator of sigma E activity